VWLGCAAKTSLFPNYNPSLRRSNAARRRNWGSKKTANPVLPSVVANKTPISRKRAFSHIRGVGFYTFVHRTGAQVVVNSFIWFHLVPSACSSARPNRRCSRLSAIPSASVFCANSVSRRGDREWEIFRRNAGAVSAEEAFFPVGCARSLCSCRAFSLLLPRVAESPEESGKGRRDSRRRELTLSASAGNWRVGQVRCRSQGSPSETLFELLGKDL
jgi:hypothetical protein